MSTIERGLRVFVTGARGFTGHYLLEALATAGAVCVLPPNDFDLTDTKSVASAVRESDFDAVIHLAGISFVGHADAAAFYAVNVVGTTNLLEALASQKGRLEKIIVASSANVYGNNPASPLHEALVPAPVNHYAASKLAMELLTRQWFDRLPIILTRPFNYTGVGQNELFLIPKIVDHFRRRAPVIELGNVDVFRDYSDVRDVAAFYIALLAAPAGQTVNLCSGQARSVASIIDDCRAITGHDPAIALNPDFVRGAEVERLTGSTTLLGSLVGERRRRPFAETLRWMLESEPS